MTLWDDDAPPFSRRWTNAEELCRARRYSQRSHADTPTSSSNLPAARQTIPAAPMTFSASDLHRHVFMLLNEEPQITATEVLFRIGLLTNQKSSRNAASASGGHQHYVASRFILKIFRLFSNI